LLNTPIISIVDDDDTVRISLDSLVRSMGYSARTYACAEDYLACSALDSTACLISDVRMPGMTGFQLFEALQAGGKCFPVIFITACQRETTEHKARDLGAAGYFRKPFNGQQLMTRVQCVLSARTAG
jgi:FixJ family two-component response regulator